MMADHAGHDREPAPAGDNAERERRNECRAQPGHERRLNARAAVVAQGAASRLLSARTAGPRPVQRVPNRTGLPDRLKAGVEALSGVSMDDVKVHYGSSKPAELNALAYAQGSDIHLAPGEERQLPHEAWHVVQQAQGRVKPTTEMKGLAINDDAGLEREADAMGARAARAKAADSGPELLERGAPLRNGSGLRQMQFAVIQRGSATSKTDEEATLQTEYAKYVAEAVSLLKGKIGFGASPEGKYDKTYWKAIEDPTYKLAIEATVKPSEAIKALFKADTGVWQFDCAEFVQICNLYATLKVYGKEAVDDKKLVLRQHGSTPFENAGVTLERKVKGNKFDAIFKKANNAYKEDMIDEETLLKSIPAGSRVCFKNPAGEGTAFRNENAIALGGGTYAAHPMGSGLKAADIVDQLVDYNKRKDLGGEDNGRSQIFISQVEILPFTPMGLETKKALGLEIYAKFL